MIRRSRAGDKARDYVLFFEKNKVFRLNVCLAYWSINQTMCGGEGRGGGLRFIRVWGVRLTVTVMGIKILTLAAFCCNN